MTMNENVKILYVEDEKSIREEMAEILDLDFPNLYLAVDGEDGLNQYTKYQPDIIITDIQMPKMDGLSMCKAIRTTDKSVKIIVTSAFSESGYTKAAKELSLDGFVSKPISMTELYKLIESCSSNVKQKD